MVSSVEFLVVGTSASAVGVLAALIDRGIKPVVIDGGIVAEATLERNVGEAGLKTWFNSSAAYRNPGFPLRYTDGVGGKASFALGGLTRVWGSTFSFETDFSKWPSDTVPSREDFDAVRNLVPHGTTVAGGELDGFLQGDARVISISDRPSFRKSRGWKVQPSVLAIDPDRESGCTPCGKCLTGCPRNAIWFAGNQILEWNAAGLIDYQPGRLVGSITPNGEVIDLHSPEGRRLYTAKRLFLATGPISTGAILVNSGLREEITLQDSATAFAAIFSLRSTKNKNVHLGSHSSSQWWVRNSEGTVAAQIYGPDLSLVPRIMKQYKLPKFLSKFVELLANWLHPVIVFIDPDESARLHIVNNGVETVVLADPPCRKPIRKALRALQFFLVSGGVLFLFTGTSISQTGGGYHSGSSLPQGTVTDYLGRLPGIDNLYIVDSSVLPQIHVGSITPTIMANAHRIGRLTRI